MDVSYSDRTRPAAVAAVVTVVFKQGKELLAQH